MRILQTGWGYLAVYLFIPLLMVGQAAAQDNATVTVVTSFPASFYEPFREAFEQENPRWRLRVVNRKTSSAITHIQSGRDDQIDLFWASSPDAFEVLKNSGNLARISPRGIDAPDEIGGFPINDPSGYYLGFAVSGSGLLWNESYLQRHGLPAPKEWEDLLDPVFHRHVAMTPPSRSGTSHLMLETILQELGWEEGWAFVLKMAGNIATLTARSYSVAESVSRQRVGVGVTLDFLGIFYTRDEDTMHFHYPTTTPFLPASIAILDGTKNREGAESFVDFLLSDEGQELLMRDDILRLPVSRSSYREDSEEYPNPYVLSNNRRYHEYDGILSSRRYHVVNMIFDELITFRLSTLSAVWQRINEVEKVALNNDNSEVYKILEEAKVALTSVPMTEERAAFLEATSQLATVGRGVPPSPSQAELEEALSSFSSEQITTASDLVLQALELLQKR